ncbi:hypothetical protein RFI_15470 [Reticulomyxa filosa]|uniref:Uncharacterized protein n=1 Tax=Reticulomyxa filosa TaxID=46433 RepID=X6N739_RETFI|nr:hypothetical protein RFI_15470 [Reticulomyxa filosa]|eukprot:ETO21733.1 hypothetical protein RFI_15470 [Reticulomyxa filosa]
MLKKLFGRNKNEKKPKDSSGHKKSSSGPQHLPKSKEEEQEANEIKTSDFETNEDEKSPETVRSEEAAEKSQEKEKSQKHDRHTRTATLNLPGYQMMGSSATNERIQQLMEWRGGPKDTYD